MIVIYLNLRKKRVIVQPWRTFFSLKNQLISQELLGKVHFSRLMFFDELSLAIPCRMHLRR